MAEVFDPFESDCDNNAHKHESEYAVHDDEVSVPEKDQDIEGAEGVYKLQSGQEAPGVSEQGAGWNCSKR